MNRKGKIKLKMKILEERNKSLSKNYGRRYNSNWKKEPYSEWALLKAELKGYKSAEKDFEELYNDGKPISALHSNKNK